MENNNFPPVNPENVHFILVEPFSPGNVGAAARAIKTMGFSKLWLINPCDHLSEDARKLAHASEDILENARVFSSLPEALADMHFVVATTNRVREYRMPTFTPEEVGSRIAQIAPEHNIALVFGREQSGLTNDELRICQATSSIPAAINHPSLNLAQAVMIYAYACYNARPGNAPVYEWELANHVQTESVYTHLEATMRQLDFVPHDSWDRFIMRFKRLFGRANPELRDVQLIHKIFQAMDLYVKYGGKTGEKQSEVPEKE